MDGRRERELRVTFGIRLQRRVPVRDEFLDRAQRQISATVAAGIRSLLLEFLPADQPRQQAVIGQIERIELIETLERVEVSAAALDQIEHRFRSEERRVGKECVSTCRSRWSP